MLAQPGVLPATLGYYRAMFDAGRGDPRLAHLAPLLERPISVPTLALCGADVAGQIAANVYASGNFAALTTDELNAAEAVLRQRLRPILSAAGVGGSIDLLRASFAANQTGLDAALDALRVEVDPATARATITNLIDNQRIVDDLASRTDATVLPATSVATALTDFQQIVAALDAFNQQFATAMPAADNAALNALLVDDFLLDGLNRAAFLSEITSQNLIGLRLDVLGLEPGSLQPSSAPTVAVVQVEITAPNQVAERFSLHMRKVGGGWREMAASPPPRSSPSRGCRT